MEYIGVSIDENEQKAIWFIKRLTNIEKSIYRLSGREFNISSQNRQEIFYDELKLPVLKKTPKGRVYNRMKRLN